MTKHRTPRPIALAIALAAGTLNALLASPGALAQQQGGEKLEEVLVTASRREEPLQDVAMAVNVVDAAKLAKAGLTGLPEVLQFVPGVSVDDSGGAFNSSVYMRGINSVLSAGVVSYFNDIAFGTSTVYSNPTPLDGTLLDLETLDVLKGPQGTLYGSSAIGGILKYNTRKPSLEDWTGSATVDMSDTHGGGLNQLYRANLNGPVVSDRFGISATGFYRDKTGYIENSAIGEDHWDDYEYKGYSGSAYWAVTDKLTITAQGLYQNSEQDGLGTIEVNYDDDTPFPGVGAGKPWYDDYETGAANLNPSEYEAKVYGLTVEYDLGFATLTSVTADQEMFFINSQDVTNVEVAPAFTYADYADLLYPGNAPHTALIFVGDQGFEKFTQELRLTSESNQSFEWIVGGYYSDEDGHNIQRLDVTPAEDFYSSAFPSKYEELSGFATGTFYFTPEFDASLGVRYTDYENDVVLTTLGPLLAPMPYQKVEDDVTTYLFNVRYRPCDNLSWYGRVASGYRPGGANLVATDPISGAPLNGPAFESDTLWSYEVGAKGNTLDGRLGYDVSLYYIEWEDYIIQLIRGGISVTGNADEAMSAGAEGSLSFAVTENFTLSAMASYSKAELTADEADLGGADGDQLPNSPEWMAAMDAQYDFQLGTLPAYVGAAWRFKGEMPVGFDGYTDSGGTFIVPSAPNFEVESYNLVDLRGGLTAGPVDVALYVTNVLDEYAYTSFSSTFASATPVRPRTVGAVVTWNFR